MIKLLLLFTFFLCNGLAAQNVSGNLSLLKEQSIRLEGFKGVKSYPLAYTKIDENGDFVLQYSKDDFGVAFLITANHKPFLLILSGENIEIAGEALSSPETMKITKGQENKWFEQYSNEHPKREQALSAWLYLEKKYKVDSLFFSQQALRPIIEQEKQRIAAEDAAFLNRLPKDSYVSWFLPTRKLLSAVPEVAQQRTDEIPATIYAFRNMDYTDVRLYKSGLFKEAIESHFWLLENSGKSLDSVFIEMKISIDVMMQKLLQDEQKLNEVSDYLFDLLERHSLFKASEYLALKVLNELSCTIDDDLAKQLETYRAMKKGSIAPDIYFTDENNTPGYPDNTIFNKMSDIHSKYKLVVFGASWCPKCSQELGEINKLYRKWKSMGIEVIFVSLDDNKEIYQNFVKPFPFVSSCDFQKWNSKTAKDYYVFGTPTMYLLNAKHKILLRPISAQQMDAYVDYNILATNRQIKESTITNFQN